MDRLKIQVTETRTFTHQFIVDVESEDELNEILDKIESKRLLGIADYEDGLERKCRVISFIEDRDGQLDEIECDNIEELLEEDI